jgi:hypothetical protein
MQHGCTVAFKEPDMTNMRLEVDNIPGPDPERASYGSFFAFNDPDGNAWIVQEVTTRRPGRT